MTLMEVMAVDFDVFVSMMMLNVEQFRNVVRFQWMIEFDRH